MSSSAETQRMKSSPVYEVAVRKRSYYEDLGYADIFILTDESVALTSTDRCFHLSPNKEILNQGFNGEFSNVDLEKAIADSSALEYQEFTPVDSLLYRLIYG